MIEIVHNWVRALVTASVVAALAKQLTPAGPVKKVTVFVSGIMLLSALLTPLLRLDSGALAQAMSDYRTTVAELTQDMESQENHLLRVYIEQQSAAYILDEARRLGLTQLEVSVRTKWGDESWVPYEVNIVGEAPQDLRSRLAGYLFSDMGIPPERQHWDG